MCAEPASQCHGLGFTMEAFWLADKARPFRIESALSDVVADGLLQELGCENMALAVLATGRSGNLSFSSWSFSILFHPFPSFSILFHPFPSSTVYTGYICLSLACWGDQAYHIVHFSAFPFIPTGWCRKSIGTGSEDLLRSAKALAQAGLCRKCMKMLKTKSISIYFSSISPI